MQEFLLRPGSKGAFAMYLFIIRLAQALERKGCSQEARRSVDIGESHLPDLFIEAFEEDFAKPFDPATFRRPPTAAEIRRGIPLDKDGFVLLTKRRPPM